MTLVEGWIPDTDPDWRLLGPDDSRKCRQPRCPLPVVAELQRRYRDADGGSRGRWVWWAYCGNHLYGRRIINGVLMKKAQL